MHWGLTLKPRLCFCSKLGRLLDSMETLLGVGREDPTALWVHPSQGITIPAWPSLARERTLGPFPTVNKGPIAVWFCKPLIPQQDRDSSQHFLRPGASPQADIPCLFLLGPGLILDRRDLGTLSDALACSPRFWCAACLLSWVQCWLLGLCLFSHAGWDRPVSGGPAQCYRPPRTGARGCLRQSPCGLPLVPSPLGLVTADRC